MAGVGDRQITKDLIDHIRNEVTSKAIQLNNGEQIDKNDFERWKVEKLEVVERNI